MNQKTKRMLSGAGAIVVALALLIGGTFAFTAYDHRSNPFRNAPHYQGRLVEDFEEKEWEKDVSIKKHISVRNVGGTEDFPGTNWGDIYARVKLKEHMDITPVDYVYYPASDAVNKVRFMTDKQGRFVKFEATGTIDAQLAVIKTNSIWSEVINDNQLRGAFLAGLTAANFIQLRGHYDNQDYWYVVTKAGDPNGQYGSFVVMDRIVDAARRESITGSLRATGIDYDKGIILQDPSQHENDECLYPTHYWDEDEPELCDLESHKYARWVLGDSRTAGDDWVMIDDWDGAATAKWILNPESGWATWGQAIPPTEYTALLLEEVIPIRMPDGEMLYVIHADMQCTDRFDMLRSDFWKDHDGNDDPWDIEGIVGEKDIAVIGIEIVGGDRTMPVDDEDQLRAIVRPGNAANKGVRWRSSDESVVTVDDNGNIKAVGEGTATITVTTDDGDFEDDITITVVPGTIPATDINITTSGPITIEVGQTKTIDYEVVPGNSTDAASLRSSNGNVSIVSNTQIKGEAVGTSIVYVEAGGISKPITVNVVAATVPATDINITTGSPMTIEVGQTLPINYSVVPGNSTDTASLRSSNGNVAIVSSTQIRGVTVGTSTVYVEAGGISKPITVNVVAATPGTLSIDVGASGLTIEVGEELDIPHTILPANTNYVVQWTTTPGSPGSVTIVNQSGRIRGTTVGTATVTLTVGGKSDTVNVTIVPAEDPQLPILGSGTYDMKWSDDFTANYSLIYDIASWNFDTPIVMDQDGTIKLSDILAASFTNYGSLSITSPDAAVASKVNLGKDKDNADAIVIKYYGTKAQWDQAVIVEGKDYPTDVQITLVLSAPGYQDTTIKVNMAFHGSLYWD